MTDVVVSAAPDRIEQPAPTPDVEPTGFGARLAWHREKAGLSVADIASRLRLSGNHVRAIEAENLAALPVIAYVRGFIRGYARAVGIDPAPLLADLGARLDSGNRAGAPRRDDRATFEGPGDGRVSRRIVVAVGVLVLVALGAIGWHTTSRPPVRSAFVEPIVSKSEPKPIAQPTVPAPDSSVVPAVASSKPEADFPANARAEPTAPSATISGATSDSVPVVQSVPVAATSQPVVEPVSTGAANLSLAFDGPCWVEITAADGKVVHSQLHPAGSRSEIAVALPLSVVLGDGSNVRVAVKGQPFDVAPYMRQNVARFTVDR